MRTFGPKWTILSLLGSSVIRGINDDMITFKKGVRRRSDGCLFDEYVSKMVEKILKEVSAVGVVYLFSGVVFVLYSNFFLILGKIIS